MNKFIGILGGTFDPIHNGHIGIAEKLFKNLPFQEIRFIPCYQPVHRRNVFANSEQRLEMLQLALESYPNFIIDDCEIQRKGPSYTIETLLELKKQIPNNPFALILGHDAWFNFLSWHHWRKILESCHIVIANRLHFSLPRHGDLADLLNQRQVFTPKELMEKRAGYIYEYPDTHFNVSATNIRQRIANNMSLDQLLPLSVIRYIQKQHLYQKSK